MKTTLKKNHLMQVNLFVPCLVDWHYPEIGKKAVFLLEKAGYKVAFDPKQVCCGRYAHLLGCKPLGDQSAKDWLVFFADLKSPLIFPDSACYHFLSNHWLSLDWSKSERVKLEYILNNCYELSQFFLEHTKLNTTSSLGRIGAFVDSPISKILSNSYPIPQNKFNMVAQLSDVTPLFFKNVTNVVKKDFLIYLRSELLLDTFIDTDVALIKQLQETAKQVSSPLRILHFTEIN